jgi:hypothetical protein
MELEMIKKEYYDILSKYNDMVEKYNEIIHNIPMDDKVKLIVSYRAITGTFNDEYSPGVKINSRIHPFEDLFECVEKFGIITEDNLSKLN